MKKSVYHMSSVENTLHQMPKYNAFAGGYGFHKSKKHPSRNQRKAKDRKTFKEYL